MKLLAFIIIILLCVIALILMDWINKVENRMDDEIRLMQNHIRILLKQIDRLEGRLNEHDTKTN